MFTNSLIMSSLDLMNNFPSLVLIAISPADKEVRAGVAPTTELLLWRIVDERTIYLACLFAFSDIRRLQGGVSYNIAIYDELFDSSFDDKGIELITEILKERASTLNECTIVISHRKESLKAVTGDIIFLEKRNGITRRVAYSEDWFKYA